MTNDSRAAGTGRLLIVGTPIGNPGDLSPRAREALLGADLVAAEDTRRTGLLLSLIGAKKRLVSYHEHNKVSRGGSLADEILRGATVALVSDAGMPGISDPGYELVSLCAGRGVPVTVIPGPCAAVTALAGSGMEASRFLFEGFLPARGRERKDRIAGIASSDVTIVLYEAPHRLVRTLEDLAAGGLGARRVTVAREMTKTYEEFLRGTVDEILFHFGETVPRGEFVLVIEGRGRGRRPDPDGGAADGSPSGGSTGDGMPPAPAERALEMLKAGRTARDIAAALAEGTGLSRNEAYLLVKKIKDGHPEIPGKPAGSSGKV